MIKSRTTRPVAKLAAIAAMALMLGACSTGGGMGGGFGGMFGSSEPPPPAEPPPAPELPASIRSEEIVGRWGLASYMNPNDRVRTENAARGQCKNPYIIGAGASGGVMMHLADEATPQELRLKGSPSGKNYIGPPGPAAGPQDREIVSFDGRILVTKFIDKDAAVRYGNMVYVRCAPRA
ncbi:hypothetical protein [Tardiphaga sp.]|jgi:hypothetical protein|uniref:hypothetical protein n=1 Tax=Tardiphaga sp. TaxID=1926292 RepID=UPI0037D9FBFA